jgi:hypothetical protein
VSGRHRCGLDFRRVLERHPSGGRVRDPEGSRHAAGHALRRLHAVRARGIFLLWVAASGTLRTIHYRSLVLGLDARSGSFRFDIPYDCEPTGDRIDWHIDLRTRRRTAAATFRVPVVRDERSAIGR